MSWLNKNMPLCDEENKPFYCNGAPLVWTIGCDIHLTFPGSLIHGDSFGTKDKSFHSRSDEGFKKCILSLAHAIDKLGLITCVQYAGSYYDVSISNEIHLRNLILEDLKNKRLATTFKKHMDEEKCLSSVLTTICASYIDNNPLLPEKELAREIQKISAFR